jgi:D-glycero-D-manno-heptose 1,7-bisphosphate phosphatase
VKEIHERMVSELASEGTHVDGVYYCPHVGAEECDGRKPKAGMLEQAARELRLDLKESFLVGDRGGDVAMAFRAGCGSVLVRTGLGEGELAWHAAKWPHKPDFVAQDLAEAVEWILREAQR